MTKHVLIQSNPPEEKKMKEHPILPNPLAELPIQGENPEEIQIYKEIDTGKLSTEKEIMDRIFRGLPVTLKKEED